MRTGLFFQWEKGSKNENAIKLFKELNIEWEYSKFGELTADLGYIGLMFPVDFINVGDDIYEIITK